MAACSLASALKPLLDGGNSFAIEGADAEWEIVQARACVLVARANTNSPASCAGNWARAHAMRAPHPVGARIVKLDARLARAEIGAHEWNEALGVHSAASGRAGERCARFASDADTLPHAAVRPWAPAHVRGEAASGRGRRDQLGPLRAPRRGFLGRGRAAAGAPREASTGNLDGAVSEAQVNVSRARLTLYSCRRRPPISVRCPLVAVACRQMGEIGAQG